MPTFGSSPGSWSGWEDYESTNNQVGQDGTVPQNGLLQSITCYLGTDTSGGAPVTLAVWRGNTVIASVGVTVPHGTDASGGQSYVTGNVSGFVPINSGEILRVGFYHATTPNSIIWSTASGGGPWYWVTSSGIGGWSGATSNSGSIGAYATYLPSAQLYINGSQCRVFVNGAQARLRINGGY